MKFSCVRCGSDYTGRFATLCKCGEMVEVKYDIDRVGLYESDNPYIRFRDLLPVTDASLLPSNTRYTPTIHAKRLGAKLGLSRLFLKNETVLPTGTTKDRNAGVVLAMMHECGVRTFCTSSTGNSASAYIRELRRYPSMKMYLFTGQEFINRVKWGDSKQVVWFALRNGTYQDAGIASRQYAQLNGNVPENGFFNFGKREGAKLAFFEAVEQIKNSIDWYVQAVSSGLGTYGVYKGAKELRSMGRITRLPRLLCVQQASCAPMINAHRSGSAVVRDRDAIAKPQGIAHAILSGDPGKAYNYVKNVVDESRGDFVAANENEIIASRRLLAETEGIDACNSTSAAVAGLSRARQSGQVGANDTVLVNLCGKDQAGSGVTSVRWLRKDGESWKPEQQDPTIPPGASAGD